jgi:hypothetical protein
MKTGNKEKKLPKAGLCFVLHLSLLLLASCGSDDGLTSDPGEQSGGQIKIQIAFDGQQGLKAATGIDFKTTWEAGDEIGLFIVKGSGGIQPSGNWVDNLPMTYIGSSWSCTLPSGKEYYPNDGDNLHFYAYYPYDSGMTDPTGYTFSVKADQNRSESIVNSIGQTHTRPAYNRSDLLLAKAENVAKSSNAVQLTFSHVLSLVQVEAKREVNMPHFDGDLTVTLTNVLPDAALNWTSDLAGTGTPKDIVMHKVDGLDYTYRALVPAQTLAADAKVTFVQSTTGKEIDMEYQGIKSAALTAKNAHKYSVILGWGIDENHEYAVGDVYPHTGPVIGIVYTISNSGKNGMVVGLQESSNLMWADFNTNIGALSETNGQANMQAVAAYIANATNGKVWSNFPAFEWVHNMNDTGEDYTDTSAKGVWYLPAEKELGNYTGGLYQAKAAVNAGLTSVGGTAINAVRYWSSLEVNSSLAYSVDLFGITYNGNKDGNYSVRCVLAF